MKSPALFLLLASWLKFVATSCGAVPVPPNIVFLLGDDLAAGAVGYAGNRDVITPNLDKLAAQSVRFRNHYDTTSICMASRCSLLTGLFEYRHGCNFDHGDLERRFLEKSYPQLLRQSGYYLGFAGKIGFLIQGEPFDNIGQFFDQWAGGPGQTFYPTEKNKAIAAYAARYPHCSRAYGAWAQDFLEKAKQSGRPFCLSVSFKAPHMPYTPDPIDRKLYDGKSFTRPANFGVENGAHLSPQAHTSRAARNYREWVEDFDGTAANYYALITGVDAAIGMIRERLEALDLARNTVIIFTSDNGYNAGSHGFGDKVLPYEEGSKAPLLIYDPRDTAHPEGQECTAVTGNVDLMATILGFAEVAAPEQIDGRSLRPLLADPHGQVRDYLPLFNFWGTESAQSMAIVTPEWKYIYWYYGKKMMPTEELFHVGQDRFEMTNAITDTHYKPVLESLRKSYDAELARVAERLTAGHEYDDYPVVFSRTEPWEKKAQLVDAPKKLKKNGEN